MMENQIAAHYSQISLKHPHMQNMQIWELPQLGSQTQLKSCYRAAAAMVKQKTWEKFFNNSVNVHLENHSFRKFSLGKFSLSKLVIGEFCFSETQLSNFLLIGWTWTKLGSAVSSSGFTSGGLCTASDWFCLEKEYKN